MTADGTYQPSTRVSTAAELDALPIGSVVQDGRGAVYVSSDEELGEPVWMEAGSVNWHAALTLAIRGPLTVLFRPDAPQPATTNELIDALDVVRSEDYSRDQRDAAYERVADALVAAGAGEAVDREAMAALLEREFGSFLAHEPHAPETFWGQRADAVLAARGDAAPTERQRCLQRDAAGDDVCDQPARYVVWGHLYEKGEKGPRCGRHLPESAYLPQTEGVFANHAIYEIPTGEVTP